MNLPNKVFTPEWNYSDGVIFYYTSKDGAWSLDTKSKRLKIPKWLNDMIDSEVDNAYRRGEQDAKRKVRDLITQLKNV